MIKDPVEVYFWWSASYVHSAKFVKWIITRIHDGSENSNKLGVGALLESDWLFGKCIVQNIQHGCKRGQHISYPYHPLYRSYDDAWKHKGKIRVPTIDEIRLLETK